jgi:PleD family two-component response regulator
MLAAADAALYRVKQSGRGRFQLVELNASRAS